MEMNKDNEPRSLLTMAEILKAQLERRYLVPDLPTFLDRNHKDCIVPKPETDERD